MANEDIRRCSSALVIREIENKTTVRYHCIPTRMATIKPTTQTVITLGADVEKLEPCNTVDEKIQWYTSTMENIVVLQIIKNRITT